VFYDPENPASFWTLSSLQAGLKQKARRSDALKNWLEQQDAFTTHKPVRKRFKRNQYTVSNILDIWECDSMDFQSLNKFNDNYTYLLTVIDVFSKFLHIVPLKSKTGPAVAMAFRSVLWDPKYTETSYLGVDG
jgi:hypothetical protein